MVLHNTTGESNDGNNEGPVTVIVDVKQREVRLTNLKNGWDYTRIHEV